MKNQCPLDINRGSRWSSEIISIGYIERLRHEVALLMLITLRHMLCHEAIAAIHACHYDIYHKTKVSRPLLWIPPVPSKRVITSPALSQNAAGICAATLHLPSSCETKLSLSPLRSLLKSSVPVSSQPSNTSA